MTAIGLFGYAVIVTKGDNFHVVTEGKAFRSAQLGSEALAGYIKQYNIQSVVNLRDGHSDEAWYKEEVAVCNMLGVQHYDVRLSSTRMPKPESIHQLIAVFKSAPRPVLIHCQGGADRTGLASAIWKVVVDKESKTEGKKQLSLRFGHLPFGKASAMDRFFKEWEPEK